MSDITPRAELILPGGGSTGLIQPDEVADIDVLNSNFRKIDSLLGARNVPSASSYGGSMDGDLVFTEDTEYLQMYSANAGALIIPRHPGAHLYTGTIAQRDSATDSGIIKDGDHWQVTGEATPADNIEYVRSGATWVAPFPRALNGSGTISVPASTNVSGADQVIDLTAGKFKGIPSISIESMGTLSLTNTLTWRVSGLSASSFNLNVRRETGSAASWDFMWTAVDTGA